MRLTGGTTSRGVRNAGSLLRNAGTVTWTDTGYFYVYSDGVVENESVWDVAGDGDLYGNSGTGTFSNEATGVFRKSVSASTMPISSGGLVFDNAGTFSVESGEVDVDRPFNHMDGGIVQGTATFDKAGSSPFTHNGDTSPGLSAGTLTWEGTYQPTDNALLFVELGGLTAGTQHDRLVVSGAATMNGTLRVQVIDGFQPSLGDAFTILTATSVTGVFDEVEDVIGFDFDVTYNATNVVLTVTFVNAPPTITSLTGDTTGEVGEPLSFSASANDPNGDPLTYTWDYGDGDTDSGVGLTNVTHAYAAAGLYTVTLTVNDGDGGTDTATLEVTVDEPAGNSPPQITSLTGDQTGQAGDLFAFQAAATDADGDPLLYTWDYGDGSPDDAGVGLDMVSHVYAAAGVYTLTLTVTDGNGGSDTATLDVTAEEPTAALVLTVDPTSPPVVIPAEGGVFSFTFTLANNGSETVTVDTWPSIEGPVSLVPNRAKRAVTLAPGASFVGTFRQRVPGNAPAGEYVYSANAGTFPSKVLVSDSFPFTKTPAGALVAEAGAQARTAGRTAAAERAGAPARLGAAAQAVAQAVAQAGAPAAADLEARGGAARGWELKLLSAQIILPTGRMAQVDPEAETIEATEAAADEAAEAEAAATKAAQAPVTTLDLDLPTAFALQPAYPNPFTDRATLRYDLPEAARVRVVVYDLLGREVARPVDGEAEAGRHEAVLDGRSLPSGVYVVRMTAGERAFTQRLTLVR